MKKIWILAAICFYSSVLFAEEDSLYTLDMGKIVITPSRTEELYEQLPQNVSVVRSGSIEDTGCVDLSAVLDRLPSINIIDYGSDSALKTVYTRGLSGSQVLVLVDGIPAHTPRDGVANLSKIDLSNVETVEVLRGPAASIYGSNAMGGVINIISKDGKSFPKTLFKTEYGLYDTRGVTFAHGMDLGRADYYFNHDSYKTDGHRENTDYEYHSTNLRFGYTPEKDSRLIVGYGYYSSESGVIGPNYWEDTDDREESWRENFDLTWKAKIFENTRMLLKAYHNIDRLSFIENFARDNVNVHQTKVYGIDLQFSQELFDKLRLTAGCTRQDYRLNSSVSAKHQSFLNGCYFEGELEPVDRMNLYFGARLDDYSNFGDRISPSGRFSWWINDNFKLHGLYGKSFRAPTYNDLYWPRENWGIWGGVEGNEQLSPEKAESYELGISTYFFKAFWSDLTCFYNCVEDLILWNKDANLWYRPENMKEAVIQGVEYSTDFVISQRLKTNFSYTFLHAKDKDTKTYLTYRPRHQYKFNLNYSPCNDWTFDLGTCYVSKRFVVDNNLNSLSHYWVADASVARKFWDIWEFQVSAKNIFDQDYEETEGYPMPGTNFLSSLKCEF